MEDGKLNTPVREVENYDVTERLDTHKPSEDQRYYMTEELDTHKTLEEENYDVTDQLDTHKPQESDTPLGGSTIDHKDDTNTRPITPERNSKEFAQDPIENSIFSDEVKKKHQRQRFSTRASQDIANTISDLVIYHYSFL